MVLKNPTINYAVLETARGGILRSGLGFDRCDIAVVTNVAGDHLGQHGIDSLSELARVKAVVPQSVFRDGKSVLNADNPFTAEMARYARGEILYFSTDEENPVVREHLRARGRAVVLRKINTGEMITIIEHRRETSLLLASQIPATFDGKLRVNIFNALAATTAALAADVQLEHIRTALKTFSTSFFQTPGRFNQLEHNGRRFLMDYCHNLAGLEALADFVSRMDAERTLGVISMPGDRLDDDIMAFGTLAATMFDELIVREDTNTRGRAQGEIAAMLRDAAMEKGLPAEKITIVLEEQQAVEEAFNRSRKDDLVVLMVDKPAQSWRHLNALTGSFFTE
jgi:cyanophycin synthetase